METIDVDSENAWVASISRKAPAQPLLRHFAALEAIVKGTARHPEPPSQQAGSFLQVVDGVVAKNSPFGGGVACSPLLGG